MQTLPVELLPLIVEFQPFFSKSVWENAQTLLVGAILAIGKRTVTACLRVMGKSDDPHFQNYHRVLNRASWPVLALSRVLLLLLVKTFAPTGELIFGIDDTTRAAARRKDQSAWHLSGPGALLSFALRQSERPALVVLHVAGRGSVGGGHLGAAFPDRTLPVGALLPRTRTRAAEIDRAGLADHSTGDAMAAGSDAGLCHRQQLRRAHLAEVGQPQSRPSA